MNFCNMPYQHPDILFRTRCPEILSGAGIHSLSPQTLLHTQNVKFWHPEQLWKIVKNHSLIFTVFYLQKCLKIAKNDSFLDLFFAIFSILGRDIKNRF